jgi:hypothetical protein
MIIKKGCGFLDCLELIIVQRQLACEMLVGSRIFGKILMAIVQIDLTQQKCDHSALFIEDNRKLWLSTILDYF